MGSNGGGFAELFGFEPGPPAYKPTDRSAITADKLAREVQASKDRLALQTQYAQQMPMMMANKNIMGLMGQQPQQQPVPPPPQQGGGQPQGQPGGLLGGIHRGNFNATGNGQTGGVQ
mgnify:FL=1